MPRWTSTTTIRPSATGSSPMSCLPWASGLGRTGWPGCARCSGSTRSSPRNAGCAAGEGKLYLCAIKDVFSNRIVGYSMDSRMKASLAVAALRNAVALRDPAGTIVHSDRGSQFRSNAYVRTLKNNGLLGSMGRVGACGDNAAMESFFSLLQKNVLDRQRWTTREELRLAIITWIERTYHRRRRQRRLGRLTPVEYETLHQPVALAA